MSGDTPKKRIRLGEIKKSPCCSPAPESKKAPSPCCASPAPPAPKAVASEWSFKDRLGALRCRLGSLRNDYRVSPGLYAVGGPDESSDVFVSANYKLSFDILRRALEGAAAWILVLDTKGINVWCAAGKSTFGTDEVVKRIKEACLSQVVGHRRIILPQLGAPGVAAHTVKKETGFRVYWGPVEAADIRSYVEAGYHAEGRMRMKGFPLRDRIVLTPMEIRPALKYFIIYAIATLAVFALRPGGLSPAFAATQAAPMLGLGLLAVFTGGFLTPAFLPWIPSRSFAIKGLLAGLLTTGAALAITGSYAGEPLLRAFSLLFFPAASSYLAVQFTGSTTFTNISGVRKELRYAIPLYALAATTSVVLLAAFKLKEAGII